MTAATNTASVLDPPPMPAPRAAEVIPHPAAPALAAAAQRAAAAAASADRAGQRQRRELLARIFAPICGIALFIAIWAGVSTMGSIPGPTTTWNAAVTVFSDPFYK